jgi:hypothetical protein
MANDKLLKRFDYPDSFVSLPDYTAHAGAIVEVLGIHPDAEHAADCELMFLIRAADGWEGAAWESELGDVA